MTTINLLYEIAIKRLETGALGEAERLLQLVIEQMPEHVNALHGLARTAVAQHRHARALELLGGLTTQLPDDPEILVTLGRAYLGAKQGEAALTCLERSLTLRPESGETFRYLSEVFLSLGRFDSAIEAGNEAVRLNVADGDAHAALGNAYLETRRVAESLLCYDRALALNPDNWQVFANRGMAYLLAGRPMDAKAALTFANALRPLEPGVALPLAGLLINLGEHGDATFLLQKLSALMPQNAKVRRYTGIIALKQGDIKTAVAEFIKALSHDAENPALQLQLAEALVKEGKLESAKNIFDGIIEINPEYLPAYVQKAKTALLQNQIDIGCRTIEAMQAHVTPHINTPLWEGGDLADKTILLYSQFGLDEFNILIRFAAALKQRSATVVVKCEAPMHPLISAMTDVDRCLLPGETLPNIDCQTSVERLPGLLRISADDAFSTPCFQPDPTMREKWHTAFHCEKPLKVAVMWRKETDEQPDLYRSIPLIALAPLCDIPGIQLFSLQTACGKEELASTGFNDCIRHIAELENADLAERLAAASACDLFIAPDCFTAQIAAAAGLPVWIILGTAPEWYFGLTGERSVWLPPARLFRQTKIGRWDDVVEKVAEALRDF